MSADGNVRRAVAGAGRVVFKLKLSKAAARILHRRFEVRLKMKVAFVPSAGAPAVRTGSVTLRRACTRRGLRHGRGKPARGCPRIR